MTIKFLASILSMLIFFLVVELVRREKLTFKYALGWLSASCAAVFFSVFDQVLFKISVLFGFELPSNFIFFMMSGIFVLLSLLLTVFLCQQNSRNDKMAQKIALLEFEIKELKKKAGTLLS